MRPFARQEHFEKDPEMAVILVVEDIRDLAAVAAHLFRIGHDKIDGYLHEGMTSWQNAGLPLSRTAVDGARVGSAASRKGRCIAGCSQ
jgi:3-mercaptopyruvate sulfurtransferase SseA